MPNQQLWFIRRTDDGRWCAIEIEGLGMDVFWWKDRRHAHAWLLQEDAAAFLKQLEEYRPHLIGKVEVVAG